MRYLPQNRKTDMKYADIKKGWFEGLLTFPETQVAFSFAKFHLPAPLVENRHLKKLYTTFHNTDT